MAQAGPPRPPALLVDTADRRRYPFGIRAEWSKALRRVHSRLTQRTAVYAIRWWRRRRWWWWIQAACCVAALLRFTTHLSGYGIDIVLYGFADLAALIRIRDAGSPGNNVPRMQLLRLIFFYFRLTGLLSCTRKSAKSAFGYRMK